MPIIVGPPAEQTLVFEVAVETAVGSGTPGSYTEVGRVPGTAGQRVGWSGIAPNDGKLRWIRCKATAPSYLDSAYTTAIAVDPWPAVPYTTTEATVTPDVGVVRVFGHAPAVTVAPPGGTYTDEEAQDAVGGILVDSATIDFTYTDATPEITAAVIDASISPTKLSTAAKTVTLAFVLDGGGAVIATGVHGDVEIPFAATITAARLVADQSGSVVVDLWKDTYANFPPTVADTITASAKPTLSSAQKSEDTTLTGWTTSVSAGDWLRVNVDSASLVQRVTLSLTLQRT